MRGSRRGVRSAVRGVLVVVAGLFGSLGESRANHTETVDTIRLSVDACRAATASLTLVYDTLKAGDRNVAEPIVAARASVDDALLRTDALVGEEFGYRLRRVARRRLSAADVRLARIAGRVEAAPVGRLLHSVRAVRTLVRHAGVLLQESAPPDPDSGTHKEPPVAPPVPPPTETPDFQWTSLTPSADSQVIYVSSSDGDDANDGFSRTSPVKTLRQGRSLMREGYPDWLLLKRGDTWTGQRLEASRGRSATEPAVFWSYGDSTDRPKLVDGGFYAPGAWSGMDHFAVVGLHMERTDPSYVEAGIAIESGAKDVLIEDCFVRGFGMNVLVATNDKTIQDARIRGCVIVDSYSGSVALHSSGLYMHSVRGILLEGCVLDHNGWVEDSENSVASSQNHNVYLIMETCSEVVVRNNIFSQGSSHGIAQGCGGVNEDNLYLRNALGLWYQGTGTIRRNVFLDGRDLDAENLRGVGLGVTNGNRLDVAENVFAHQKSGSNAIAISLAGELRDSSLQRNVVHGWVGPTGGYALMNNATAAGTNKISANVFAQPKRFLIYCEQAVDPATLEYSGNTYNCDDKPSNWFEVFLSQCGFDTWVEKSHETGASSDPVTFVDPTRSIETYSASLGADASFRAFIDLARRQSRSNWRSDLTARTVSAWVREGFAVAPK